MAMVSQIVMMRQDMRNLCERASAATAYWMMNDSSQDDSYWVIGTGRGLQIVNHNRHVAFIDNSRLGEIVTDLLNSQKPHSEDFQSELAVTVMTGILGNDGIPFTDEQIDVIIQIELFGEVLYK